MLVEIEQAVELERAPDAGPTTQPLPVIPDGSSITLRRDENGRVVLVAHVAVSEVKPGAVRAGFDPWAFDPATPDVSEIVGTPEFAQRVAAIQVSGNRQNIESDGVTLLSALNLLFRAGVQPPAWLTDAFVKRWARFDAFEARTLDECFDHEPMTERLLRAKRGRRELMFKVHDAVVEANRLDGERALDNELWEEIGERFGIGRVNCQSLYAEAVRDHGRQDVAELKRIARSLPKKTSE